MVPTPTPRLTVDLLLHPVLRPRSHLTSEDEAVEEEVGAGSDRHLAVIPTVPDEEGTTMFLPLLLRHRLGLKRQWTDSNLTMRCFDLDTDRHRTTTMPRQQWMLAYRLSDDRPVLPRQDRDQDQILAITLNTMVMDKEVSNLLHKVMAMGTGTGTGTDSPMGMGVAMGILRIGDLHQRNRP